MSDEGWVTAAKRSALAPGDVLGVLLAGKEIALYDLDGEVFATDDICTHAYAKLSEGRLRKTRLICPLHGGSFDCRTGAAIGAPAVVALGTYVVRVTGEEVQIALGEQPAG